jgi:hypothetical protein
MTELENERNAIDVARRCQRNWDLSKTIPEEHIDHWIYLATHAPSKQDESFFDLYVLTDREKIDYLMREHSWGFTAFPGRDWVVRNPQMGANILFCFNRKMNEMEVRNHDKFGIVRDPNATSRWDNAYTAIGIASGIVAFSAAKMGYATGYGKNFGYKENPDSQREWGSVLGIPDDENRLTYSLGIGFPNENLKWSHSENNKEYLTGGPAEWEEKEFPSDYKYFPYSTKQRIIKVAKI